MLRRPTNGVLYLTSECWAMMRRAETKSRGLEVYGCGHATIDGDMLVMDDLYIPPQTVTPGSIDVSGKEFLKMWDYLAATYGDKWTEWCVYWHSHCDMSVSPSLTDTDALAEVVANNLPYAVGLITNYDRRTHAWVELTRPWSMSAPLDVLVESPSYPDLFDRVDKMMEQVEERRVVSVPGYSRRVRNDDDMAKLIEDYYAQEEAGVLTGDDDGRALATLDQAGITVAATERLPTKAVDRLALAILEAGNGKGGCKAAQGSVKCILIAGHKQKIHVGVLEGSPAYFQSNGEPPKVAAIRAAGWPI